MKKTYSLLAFCFVLILASCSSKPESLIIGKWQEIGSTNTLEFFQDGTVKITGTTGLAKKSGTGTYKFIDGSRLKFEGALVMEVKILISSEKLTLTDPEGKVWTYQKIKWFA